MEKEIPNNRMWKRKPFSDMCSHVLGMKNKDTDTCRLRLEPSPWQREKQQKKHQTCNR